MVVPSWLTLIVAAVVILFGAYRLRLGFRSDAEDERARAKRGLYAMARRTHILIAIIYLGLGGALVATSFGWRPFGGLFGSSGQIEPTLAPIHGPARKVPVGGVEVKPAQ